MSKKNELLYIMNPGCGWCKKSDPVVEELKKDGYLITTLNVGEAKDAEKANEAKAKHNVQCGTPLFLDTGTGNMVCGFREKDILEKWANGENIPAPPPRPRPNKQPQGPANLDIPEFRFSIFQEAKSSLMEKFYNEYEVWNNWQFDTDAPGDCPVAERPLVPTTIEIRSEAEKIYAFCSGK